MKKRMLFLLVAAVCIVSVGTAHADHIVNTEPIDVTPPYSHFYAADEQTPFAAWVYPNNPDIWQFRISGFTTTLVRVQLFVGDWYPGYPDDYNVYWGSSFVGNTGGPSGKTFIFNTTQDSHDLRIEYVNLHEDSSFPPHWGGSYYNLILDVRAVPIPGAVWLLGSGLFGLVVLRRRLKN